LSLHILLHTVFCIGGLSAFWLRTAHIQSSQIAIQGCAVKNGSEAMSKGLIRTHEANQLPQTLCQEREVGKWSRVRGTYQVDEESERRAENPGEPRVRRCALRNGNTGMLNGGVPDWLA
jgi:hypothetical protein